MNREDYLMRRWKLALDRQKALGRRRGPEFQKTVFWVAMWGSLAMAEKGICRFDNPGIEAGTP